MKNDNISIILVNPQLAENIGSCARAMLNFGITDLRLVKPRNDIQMDKALAISVHARQIVEQAKTYETFDKATFDKVNLYATTSRKRAQEKEVVSSAQITDLKVKNSAFIFGCEASGLDNNVISKCDKIVSIPVGSSYASLNISQAVVIVAYELLKNKNFLKTEQTEKANKEEFNNLINFFNSKIDQADFYKDQNKKQGIEQSVTNIFNKADMTTQEVRLIRGILKKIT